MSDTIRTLTDAQERETARSLARDYGSDVTTQEVCARIYELDPSWMADEFPAEESITRIQELVTQAQVVVLLPGDYPTDIGEINAVVSDHDGKPVVEIITRPGGPTKADGNPDIRVYVNDGQVYGEDVPDLFDTKEAHGA